VATEIRWLCSPGSSVGRHVCEPACRKISYGLNLRATSWPTYFMAFLRSSAGRYTNQDSITDPTQLCIVAKFTQPPTRLTSCSEGYLLKTSCFLLFSKYNCQKRVPSLPRRCPCTYRAAVPHSSTVRARAPRQFNPVLSTAVQQSLHKAKEAPDD